MFAHQILPALFFNTTEKFIPYLEKEEIKFLQTSWDKLGAKLGKKDFLPSDGLKFEVNRFDNGTVIAIITLPSPHAITEAFFTAVVYRAPTNDQELIARYFTLEYGYSSSDDNFRTVLCEWTPDKIHHNLGTGPEPTSEAFLNIINKQIE